MTPRAIVGRLSLGLLVVAGAALASFDVVTLGQYLPYAIVGSVLVARRPGSAIAWLLLAIGFVFIGTSTPPDLDLTALAAGTASDRDFLHVWVGTWAGTVLFILFAALTFVFPSGRMPRGRTGAWAWAVLGLGVAVALGSAFTGATFVASLPSLEGASTEVIVPNRLSIMALEGGPRLPNDLLDTLVIVALLASGAVTTIGRYRRGTDLVRLQLRWFMTSVVSLCVAIAIGLVGTITLGSDTILIWIPTLLAYFAVPAAIGIAVMRYHLFDIDRLISRTIAYALVTAVLFGVFAGVNLALQASLGSIIRGNSLAVAISTLVVAALFNPLRVRLQRLVDRRFNRVRADQEAALVRFTIGLRDEVDVERVLDAMRAAAVNAVEPTAAGVWQRRTRAAP